MPLVTYYSDTHNTQVFLWHIVEDYQYFSSKLSLSQTLTQELEQMIPKRRLEWILPRYMLTVIAGTNPPVYQKDKHGKPHLKDSTTSISISHSGQYLALIKSDVSCGIDVQKLTKSIHSIRHKFTDDKELELFTSRKVPTPLHIIWSSKEAIFKCYGRRKVSIKSDIAITAVKNNRELKGSLQTPESVLHYDLFNIPLNGYTLVYALKYH